ncbi:venom acid phosphatase Acph-1 isoform X2 [Cephus cinctus]|nr:venom acid phosphatase Acph-1 isoform X2 [Cephus cinctus]
MHQPATPVIRVDDSITSSSESPSYILDTNETMDMTNKEKLIMYNLGIYLRKKYGEFLGDIYMPTISKTITSDSSFSKISALLVNAALWPPVGIQRWKEDLNWQPVSISYEQKWNDTLMLGRLCPNFITEKDKVDKSSRAEYVVQNLSQLFNYLREETKFTVETISDVAALYKILRTNVKRSVTLPAWSDDIFPNGHMLTLMEVDYELLGKTNLQRQLNGGVLLKKIILDTIAYMSGDNNTKIYQYSGDDINLIGLLHAMNIWIPYVPQEGTAIIFEVYKNTENNVYAIKINTYSGDIKGNASYSFPPTSDILYEVIQFARLHQDYLSLNEQNLCGWDVTGDDDEFSSDAINENSSSLFNSNFHFIMIIVGFHIVHSYNKP